MDDDAVLLLVFRLLNVYGVSKHFQNSDLTILIRNNKVEKGYYRNEVIPSAG